MTVEFDPEMAQLQKTADVICLLEQACSSCPEYFDEAYEILLDFAMQLIVASVAKILSVLSQQMICCGHCTFRDQEVVDFHIDEFLISMSGMSHLCENILDDRQHWTVLGFLVWFHQYCRKGCCLVSSHEMQLGIVHSISKIPLP